MRKICFLSLLLTFCLWACTNEGTFTEIEDLMTLKVKCNGHSDLNYINGYINDENYCFSTKDDNTVVSTSLLYSTVSSFIGKMGVGEIKLNDGTSSLSIAFKSKDDESVFFKPGKKFAITSPNLMAQGFDTTSTASVKLALQADNGALINMETSTPFGTQVLEVVSATPIVQSGLNKRWRVEFKLNCDMVKGFENSSNNNFFFPSLSSNVIAKLKDMRLKFDIVLLN
jgi:hypothetical protein